MEEAQPSGHRLLGLEHLQRHRIDQDLQAASERALRGDAALRLALSLIGSWALLAATELRPLACHARPRQAYGSRLAHFHRPAHGNRHARRILRGGTSRLYQLGRRAPVADSPCRRLALTQQMLDVVTVDQHRAGHTHHGQRQQQDQADPQMQLLQPITKSALLSGHRGVGRLVSRRRGRGRSGRSRARRHRPAPACRRR